MSALPHDRARLGLAIFLVASLAAASSVASAYVPNTWIFRDGRFYVNVTTTIVERLSLEQHAFASSWYSGTLGWNRDLDPGWSNIALGRNGEHWPKHPYVLPILASPLYFAFGLPATLLFNLLIFGAIAAGLYRFARAYADPSSAALASVLFVFATSIARSAYDYSTDVLMLGFVALGLAAVKERRGAWAGVCIALAVIIKPTALMLVPSLVLLFFERTTPEGGAPDWATTRRALGRSLLAGTVALGLFALANTWMYGRPWWSGYNRTLVTSGGAPSVASHVDSFSVPFEEGLTRVLYGDYGLVPGFAILTLALPGLVLLLRRRPRAALATTWAVGASLAVFSRYVYEGHRFHWPALALLVPALAVTFAWIGRRLPRDVARPSPRRWLGAPAIVSLAAAAATLFVGQGSASSRLGGGAWPSSALAVLEGWLEPEAAAVALVVLHAVTAGLFVASLFASLGGPRALRVAALFAPFGVPEVRAGFAEGGPLLFALAGLSIALASLAGPFVERGPRGLLPALARDRVRLVVAVAALSLSLFSLLSPSASGDASHGSLAVALASSASAPGPARALWPLLAVGLPGLAVLARRALEGGVSTASARLDVASLAVLTILSIALLAGSVIEPRLEVSVALGVFLASAAALPLVGLLAGWLGALARDRRQGALALGALLLACLAAGGVRRAEANGRPFSIASEAAVREAIVFLDVPGLGEVPCDFLAWEHVSWECATFDRGVHNEVGLAIDEPLRVGGVAAPSFLLSSGARGERRRVVFPSVQAGPALTLRWAVPDGQRGSGTLVVRVDDRERARLELPAAPSGEFRETRIETPDVGERARVELELVGARGASVVLLRGGW